MPHNDFIDAGNLVWWYGIGACLIIAVVVLLFNAVDRRKENREILDERLQEIDQHLSELYKITDDLREKELQRARREIRGRERRADKKRQEQFLTALDEDQIEFMKTVTEGINEL